LRLPPGATVAGALVGTPDLANGEQAMVAVNRKVVTTQPLQSEHWADQAVLTREKRNTCDSVLYRAN